MRTIELVPGVRSSVIGFGCAPILGSVDAARARRAVQLALDCGVTHFDVARSYGYGEAERFLGQILRGRRSDVVIATKFGIEATPAASLLRIAKPIVRSLLARRKRSQGGTTAGATAGFQPGRIFVRRAPLTVRTLRRSLEKSLGCLRTDYVDCLFLHEPREAVVEIDDLAAEAARLKQAGRIRAWGIAFNYEDRAIHDAYLDRFDVLQFNNSPGAPHYPEVLASRQSAANVFFSPLRGSGSAQAGSELLRTMISDFSRSVVLCSMFSESHIRENTSVA
ncbi:MAG: aldo/keto reductase [Chthoniobacterales bacterium]